MVNETGHFLAEYSQRKRLAKLGFTSPLCELSAFKAEVYAIIDAELDECQQRELRAARNGRK